MRRMIGMVVLAITACAPRTDTDGGAFRASAAPIYSIAGFDASRLDGRWDQVAAFSDGSEMPCRAGGADFAQAGAAMAVRYDLCLPGGPVSGGPVSGAPVSGAGAVRMTGPGRFAISGTGRMAADWWVLWVDEGYRTLAIGTPSGEFGFILNRGKTVSADRLAAAREVLDFNGYRLETLVVFP